MNAGRLIILRVTSLGRNAQNERDGAAAAQLRPATAPSQQHYNLALKWSSHRCVPPRGAAWQHLEEGRGAAAAPGGRTRAAAAAQ